MDVEPHLVDWETIKKCREGDEEAWRDLYDKYKNAVYHYSLQAAHKRRLDSHDALSNGHLAFFRCVGTFDPDRKVRFLTLLVHSVTRAAWKSDRVSSIKITYATKKQAESKKALTPIRGDAAIDMMVALPQEDTFGRCEEEYEWQQRVLVKCMKKLPQREAEIIERRLNGEKLHEIGGCLKLSKERVRQLESRAKDQLREMIECDPSVAT